MSAPLELEKVSFSYRRESLFNDVDLTVKPGEFVTIMGENGVGKSTLIDCLLGHANPHSGKIRFWGMENGGANRAKILRDTGFVQAHKESHAPWLTIDDVITATHVLYDNWNNDLFMKLAGDFSLDLKTRIGSMSSGEASKFRLLKAVSFEPKLLVLDELTANLSPQSKEAITRLLLDRFALGNLSILYICHSTEESMRLSDRVLTLTKNGLVEGASA